MTASDLTLRQNSDVDNDVLIAVDLGGTQLRTAVFDPSGAMLARRSVATPRQGGQAVVVATVSTGIGCGVIGNGRLLTGHSGHAGELGRVRIPTSSGLVRLEEISSGTAIAATARAKLATDAETSLRALAHPETVTAAEVAAAANTGDPLAQQIFTQASETLGIQLANLVKIVDPETIAIGGGVTLAGDAFWNPLRATIAASLAQDSIALPRLLAAGLQGDVGLHGAFLALLESFGSQAAMI